MGWMDWTQLHHCKNIRCPYCADGIDFRLMMPQGRSHWYMCASCGHLSLPSSRFYQCTCKNCSKLESKTRLWNGGSFPVAMQKRSLVGIVHLRLQHLSQLFRRMGTFVF